MNELNYGRDSEWNEAKNISRLNGFQNQWIDVIDFYNSIGGQHVQVYCVLESQKYRILYILDSKKVLLLDKFENLVIRDYPEVNQSQKTFYFQEEPELDTYDLPEGETYFTEKFVNLYT